MLVIHKKSSIKGLRTMDKKSRLRCKNTVLKTIEKNCWNSGMPRKMRRYHQKPLVQALTRRCGGKIRMVMNGHSQSIAALCKSVDAPSVQTEWYFRASMILRRHIPHWLQNGIQKKTEH